MDGFQTSLTKAKEHSPAPAYIHRVQEYSIQRSHPLTSEVVGHNGWVPTASSSEKKTAIQMLNFFLNVPLFTKKVEISFKNIFYNLLSLNIYESSSFSVWEKKQKLF